jgi:hypothetical protein
MSRWFWQCLGEINSKMRKKDEELVERTGGSLFTWMGNKMECAGHMVIRSGRKEKEGEAIMSRRLDSYKRKRLANLNVLDEWFMWRTIRKIGWPLVPFNGRWNTPLLWQGVQEFFQAPYLIPGWGRPYGGAGNIQLPAGMPGTPFFVPQYPTGERGGIPSAELVDRLVV